jgi:hypothetical protein
MRRLSNQSGLDKKKREEMRVGCASNNSKKIIIIIIIPQVSWVARPRGLKAKMSLML